MRSKLLKLIIRYPEVLLSRNAIIDIFADSELLDRTTVQNNNTVRLGSLFTEDGIVHAVTGLNDDGIITETEDICKVSEYTKLSFYDRFMLEKGMIANYTGPPVETTCGLFLLNYTVLVDPFGNTIPYVNKPWKISEIENMIAEAAIAGTIQPRSVYKYIDNIHALSSLNDFCVPAMSEKSITSNAKVLKRKDELMKHHPTDPAELVSIEDELIALDKAELEGDMSNGFMISGKNYTVHRKRMFIGLGMVESFGDEIVNYDFVSSSLNSGWDLSELDILANDIRRGSYSRAKTTALGGAESKMLGRNFQESKIIADDCGSRVGIPFTVTNSNKKHILFRNIITRGGITEITPSNVDSYIGETVMLRSPMTCKTEHGYCYACMDTRFKRIGIKMLNIAPVSIGSAFLTSSLKAMHGTKVAMFNIDDLNTLLV